jgi:hypothetical protein
LECWGVGEYFQATANSAAAGKYDLLNIQANGTIHKSDKVTITALGNNSSIVTIDLTQVTPTTQATLYFNLLGFGARTSTVT